MNVVAGQNNKQEDSLASRKQAQEAFFQQNINQIELIISRALEEDLGSGDITANSIVSENVRCTADVVLKESAIVAGLKVFELVMTKCDSQLTFETFISEGEFVEKFPKTIARVSGNARAVLAAERTALNLIQRMCGIATLTRKFSQKAEPFGIEILDTRKTTPGLRVLEKLAVFLGGGTNHRFGLYDMILIKDNHIAIAGGIAPAVENARKGNPGMPVEVEVCSLDQLKEALALKAERIMLDNMNPETVKKAVEIVSGAAYIEVSGGIRLDNLDDYLIPGVSGISVGALTHSIKNIDISLEF